MLVESKVQGDVMTLAIECADRDCIPCEPAVAELDRRLLSSDRLMGCSGEAIEFVVLKRRGRRADDRCQESDSEAGCPDREEEWAHTRQ